MTSTMCQSVMKVVQRNTTDIHHILSVFSIVSCNWYACVK